MAERVPVAIFAVSYPVLSETFVTAEVAALRELGHDVRVEAVTPPATPNPEAPAGVPVAFVEDDGLVDQALALAWLALRHPLRCLRDTAMQPYWRRDEAYVAPLRRLAPVARRLQRAGTRHLHAHFANRAALDAIRVGRLLGLSTSVTAHAYDIYKVPANLAEKLRSAGFATSGCDYTVRDLRVIAGPAHADRIHRIIMGVDADAFRRETEYPGGRRVLAVGRLVEKKGFADLVDAVALLERSAPLDALVILGDGPMRSELEAHIARLGLQQRVTLLGSAPPSAVRDELERADVLAMPCVVAADGDRDSMPVVVKEALAMEVPVVASAEVGLPELVRDDWGRLCTPRDPKSLAEALREVLALPASERRALGERGRAFVSEHCSVATETAKLSELIARAAAQVQA